jgi:L-rhamnose-H+ transport protein
METSVSAILAVIAGGVLNGTFAYPMKNVDKWRWENIWFLFGVFGLILFPWLAAWLSLPHLLSVYRVVPGSTIAAVLALGLAWGIGSVLFGLGISSLGLSLGYCIIMGTTAIFGTVIPALYLEKNIFASGRGLILAASLVLIVVGLKLCSIAGSEREQQSPAEIESGGAEFLSNVNFRKGLAICLLSGVLSACFNIGFAVTADISHAAERLGAAPSNASFPVWTMIMSAGFLPSFVYCVYLFRRNHSFPLFASGFHNWGRGLLMGIFWIFAIKLYSTGAASMGAKGATVGWPILISSAIIGANLLGIITGEWNKVGRKTTMYLYSGLTTLLLAVILAGRAGLAE